MSGGVSVEARRDPAPFRAATFTLPRYYVTGTKKDKRYAQHELSRRNTRRQCEQ